MYLIALNLRGMQVAVIGGGKVAARKIPLLVQAGADVTVISPDDISSEIEVYISDWIKAPYSVEFLDNAEFALVFAATDDAELNEQIRLDAQARGSWVNVVSNSENSDFHNVSVLQKSPISIGISTGGTSPALLTLIKQRIEKVITDEIVLLANWLHDLRRSIPQKLPTQAARQALYKQIVHSDVLSILEEGSPIDAQQRFDQIVREHLT